MQLLNSVIIFVLITMALPVTEAYRILGLFPFNGKSHFAMHGKLMKGLAERGHQVDVVSHYPLKNPFPNYTDVVNLSGTVPELVNNVTVKRIEQIDKYLIWMIATESGIKTCELMNHPKLRELIKNPPKNPAYDLIIAEIFGANCYLAMGQHLKVPVVGVVTSAMAPWMNDLVANPDDPAHIPHSFSNFNRKMNFWQRVINTVDNFRAKLVFIHSSEIQTDAIKKYIGPHAPSIREAERNVSLILVNSHHSLNGVRPLTTAVVEVGGLHINDKEANLPNDLQTWLDDSGDGFIYISFGSMLKMESLPEKTLATIYASLAKLAPIRVLMKIAEPEKLPFGLPSNVLTRPWTPQLAVLKHKHIRAFMTHGGLMGTQEAIYYGVPMIGVPFFGDQAHNIESYSQINLAVALNYRYLTEEKLDAAFKAVLHDPSYRDAAKKISALFRDRPMSAMDTAIFWIEYVIRHGGTNLRSPAMDLTWWQIALLDVYGFLLSFAILALYCAVVVVKKLTAVFYSRSERCVPKFTKVN